MNNFSPSDPSAQGKSPKPHALQVKPDHIPDQLKALHEWVCWVNEYQPKRNPKKPWTKVPISVVTRRRASSTNPKTWSTFKAVLACYRKNRKTLDGIGLVLCKDNHLVGVDLDHCRDPDTGEIQAWAWEIVRELDTYTEASPSGTGLHCYARGTLPGTGRHKDPIEVYDRGRYLTVTGHHVEGTPATIEPRQDVITTLYERLSATPKTKPRPQVQYPNGDAPRLEDEQLLEKALAARNGNKLARLWAGDIFGYPSQSEADLALCTLLAFWTQDEAQLDRLFRQSRLMRDKWGEFHGEATYGQMTIRTALEQTTEHYHAPKRRRPHGTHTTAAAPTAQTDTNGTPPAPQGDATSVQAQTPETPQERAAGNGTAASAGDPPEQKPERKGWQSELLLTRGGLALETLGNVSLALQHLEPWASSCWYDMVRDLRMVGTDELDDTLVTQASLDLERRIVMPIRAKHLVATALTYLCHQHERDLLREWLEGLPPWDQTPRLATWLTTYAHAEASAYAADISRLVPVSMVARALNPGCQYRFVVILEGPENAGKSKLVRALGTPEWYRELSHGLEGKEAHMRIRRAWVAELAELSSVGKTDDARLKAFFTMHEDVYIPKFSNFEVVHKRRTVFIGTINPEGMNTYLRGQSGNTRYLPIAVRDINVEGFEQVHPQVFAEALRYYREHPDDWWQLSSDGAHAAEEAREERRQRSVYEDALGSWLERTGRTVTWWEEIAEDYLHLPKERWADRRVQMEIATALKALGWYKDKRERMGDAGLVVPWRPGADWHPEP